ncbi:MAG: DUF2617 family protein [Tomitella sp.]|nr:DUF2617 family protein [Tomitella sp.]
MTFHEFTVPPRDVGAEELCLTIGSPAPDALAELALTHPRGGVLTLGVLGASHVVSIDTEAGRFTEQISCNADPRRTPLPRRYGDDGYQLTADTRELRPSALRRLGRLLRLRAEGNDHWITGRFPGDVSALTSLSAAPIDDGWQWRTWHLYPAADRGVVVRTESRWSQ